jgi:hypothetical protein
MEWTPEAVNAEVAYRQGDPQHREHLRAIREHHSQTHWWQRLRWHRSQEHDDGNGQHRAA